MMPEKPERIYGMDGMGPKKFDGPVTFNNRVWGLDNFTNDYDHGYIDFGALRIVFAEATITPSWNNATTHAWSGAHTDTLPAAVKDTNGVIVASIIDTKIAARSCWLPSAYLSAADTATFYLACPQAAENDVTALTVSYIVIGGVP